MHISKEATKRNRTSNHKIRLSFNGGFINKSERVRNIKLIYQYGSQPKKVKASPIYIPMNVWDNKKREIKEEFRSKYSAFQDWINEYRSKRDSLMIDLYNEKISYQQAFDKILNYVKDGYILDTFEKFCNSKGKNRKKQVITKQAIKKHIKHINALQTYFRSIGKDEYSLLKYSHIRISSHHINTIWKLVSEHPNANNDTKNRYIESLNYASYVNPNVSDTKPFEDKYDIADDSQTEVAKNLSRKELTEGISRIGNNPYELEAYLFWLLSFSLRGVDGADICAMDKSWLVDEKGKAVNLDKIGHYFPDYKTLVDRKELRDNKNFKDVKHLLPKKFNQTLDKIYICGYRTKPTNKVGIRILFNHYPTLIIHRLLKKFIGINRPHLLYRGDDKMKLYNIDYSKDEGKDEWKNLQGTYTKQMKRLCGDNGKLKHTRHTFTTELNDVFSGNGADKMLGVSLGHRQKKVIERYVKVPQFKIDILHMEVLSSYGINKALNTLIKVCSKPLNNYNGRVAPMIDLNAIYPIISEREIEALKLPLSIWDWKKEEEYNRLINNEEDVHMIDTDENGKPVYEEVSYSDELKELIKERNQFLSKHKMKRETIDYSRPED